jgi:hypothetical protein
MLMVALFTMDASVVHFFSYCTANALQLQLMKPSYPDISPAKHFCDRPAKQSGIIQKLFRFDPLVKRSNLVIRILPDTAPICLAAMKYYAK